MALWANTSANAAGYICAEGGGGLAKGSWAAGVFQWMIEHGGSRKVVVLDYHADADPEVQKVFRDNGAAEVKYLRIPDRATADAAETAADIMAADILWMCGGDQSEYVKNWRGTRTETAIRAVYERGGVIGGTSAGAAVLGEVIYDAFNGSLASQQALSDAFHPVMTLTTGFLSLTPGVLFDTHFNERGRIGRQAVMLARRYEDAQQDLVGVGLDYRTALCVYPDLTAEVRGEGSVTILHRTETTQQIILRGRPPTITNLRWLSLTQGYRYDLKSRTVIERPAVAMPVGTQTELADYSISTIDGGVEESRMAGEFVVEDGGDRRALFEGRLQTAPGRGELSRTILVPRMWNENGRIENRAGGAVFGLAMNPGFLAVLLPENCILTACEPAILAIRNTVPGVPSTLLLDSHECISAAAPRPESDEKSTAARQSVAIEPGYLHILSDGAFYNTRLHRPILAKRPHDLNADGLVNKDDLNVFVEAVYGRPASAWQIESIDANRDRLINRDDEEPFVEALLSDTR